MIDDDRLDDLDADEEDVAPTIKTLPSDASDRAIERYYESGRLRVIQDKNDFFLPHVVDFIEGRKWGNLRPDYQRRLRWDNNKKSKLIESFVMNVPVPPIFLYEKEIGRFEVMDGQQRLSTIVDFLKNRFTLSGLKIWPSLNGRNYDQLPSIIRRGLDRAKISAITLMSDTGDAEENSLDLRAQVFERLNTGGEQLNQQELRNSLYSGQFNKLLIDLSEDSVFTMAWNIPNHEENTSSDGTPGDILKNHVLFKRMADVEIVLRFFAFMNPERISGSVRSMLDNTMKERRAIGEAEAQELSSSFKDALNLCSSVLGRQVFRIPAASRAGASRLSRPFYDAQMVAFHQLSEYRDAILESKTQVREAILNLARPKSPQYDLIVGRANTSVAVKERITAVQDAIIEAL